jgi:tRNA pseudouridine55 synthase
MDFLEGAVLLIDKPYGWTSFDAVNKIRWHLKRALKVKKIKVGHAGTLDPLATGLLVICTGKFTKKIEELTGAPKTYTGTFLLGKTTPSFDLETAYNENFPVEHITKEAIEQARLGFLGEQMQTPPIFSAKQVDGKRAYELARAGKEIELKQNRILIEEFEIDASRFPEIDFKIKCSKGTYIRSIAHDFGKSLDSGATLIALRRTHSGELSVEDAKTPEEWISFLEWNNVEVSGD